MNKHLAERGGVMPEEMIGKRAEDFAPITADRAQAYDTQVLETGKAVPYQEFEEESGEEPKTWLETKIPIEDDGGAVRYVLTVALDITERKLAEQALRETEQRLQTVADNIPGTVFQRVLEADGTLHTAYVGGSMREVYGVSPEDAMADFSAFLDLLHPDDRERFERQVRESARTLAPLDMELRIIGPEGKVHWVRNRSRPRRLGNGAVIWDGGAR